MGHATAPAVVTKATVFLRLREVIARTGRTRSRIYVDMAAGSFPKPVRIGRSAVAWVESEIEDWAAACIAARDERAAA